MAAADDLVAHAEVIQTLPAETAQQGPVRAADGVLDTFGRRRIALNAPIRRAERRCTPRPEPPSASMSPTDMLRFGSHPALSGTNELACSLLTTPCSPC